MKWFGYINKLLNKQRKCKGKSRRGNPCQKTPKKGSKYCSNHILQSKRKYYIKYLDNISKKWNTVSFTTKISLFGVIIAIIALYFSALKPKVSITDNIPYSIAKEAKFNIHNEGNFQLRNTKVHMGLIYIRTKDNIRYATYGDPKKPIPYFADKMMNMGNIESGDNTTFFIPENFKSGASGEWEEGAMCVSISYSYFLHGREKKEVGFLLKDNQWEPRSCNELDKRYPPMNYKKNRNTARN